MAGEEFIIQLIDVSQSNFCLDKFQSFVELDTGHYYPIFVCIYVV